MPRTKPSLLQFQNQLKALKQRVSWIENALKPKQAKAALRDGRAHKTRLAAESDERHRALREYYEQKQQERYEEFPEMLKVAREAERELNAYLRERGLKAQPSRIPKGLSR